MPNNFDYFRAIYRIPSMSCLLRILANYLAYLWQFYQNSTLSPLPSLASCTCTSINLPHKNATAHKSQLIYPPSLLFFSLRLRPRTSGSSTLRHAALFAYPARDTRHAGGASLTACLTACLADLLQLQSVCLRVCLPVCHVCLHVKFSFH